MAIRKYRKKMNGGSDVANKFLQGASDVHEGAKYGKKKFDSMKQEANLAHKNALGSYKIAMRSGSTGGTALSAPMNNLSIPPSMPPPPPQLGGKRRRRRKTRRRKRKTRRRRRKTRRRRRRSRRR